MGGSNAVETSPVGALAVSARALAPDLARGAMLLLIALANACLYQYGNLPLGGGLWLRGHPAADQVILLVETIFVRGRAYPMYALLFGYGLVQLLRRYASRGIDEATARRTVRRRGLWMLVIGFCHAVLLFGGDIIGAYGLIAVLLVEVMFRAKDRVLLITSAVWVSPIALFRGLEHRLSPLRDRATDTPELLYAALLRVLHWIEGSIIGSLFMLVPAVLLGVWAARRRLLDEPALNQRFLARAAVIGMSLAAAGGLPWALVRATWWKPSSDVVSLLAGGAHTFSGYAGGVGLRRDRRPGRHPGATPQRARAGYQRAGGLRAAIDDLLPAAVRGVRRGAGRLRRRSGQPAWPHRDRRPGHRDVAAHRVTGRRDEQARLSGSGRDPAAPAHLRRPGRRASAYLGASASHRLTQERTFSARRAKRKDHRGIRRG